MLELLDRYRHKIKSAEELRDIIGPRPRKKRVIMCHGVFDVVHPGHVRHLLYARSKADLLIASITADHHITKGTHRPHVPQDLRAINLAATYGGVRLHPVLLARATWADVPDEGARSLPARLVPSDDLTPPGDVDFSSAGS